jgi:hypothetical protein
MRLPPHRFPALRSSILGHGYPPLRSRGTQLLLAIAIAVGSSSAARSQLAPDPLPLPPGVEQITEGRVLATISFLASDELAGRGTGTPEFNIAAAYVASRFRGAGLEGGGAEGSFYHETKAQQIRTPVDVRFASIEGMPIAHSGLLVAADEAIEHEGSVTTVSLDAWREGVPEGTALSPVVRGAFATQAKGSRAMSQLSRLASGLHRAGVRILILDAEEDSEWVRQAEMLRAKPRMESAARFPIPIVLVSPATVLPDAVRLMVPPSLREESVMRNVIGVLRGSEPDLASEAVLFSAHLDHLGTNPKLPGDGIYNGADDDASGVTAVLTLADAFAAMPQRPKRSLIFMAFWGEESGLLGSKRFVAEPTWPLDKIVANVNIEMIGRPEGGARGKIWMTGWQESDLGTIMRDSALRWGTEIFEHPKFSSMLYRSSDNWSFVERGVVAHSFSAGSLHADYHQPDDEWDRLEIPHMTQVIRGLLFGSLPLAEGAARPKATTK